MTACDHTSVGVLVFRDGKLLLVQRRKPPYGLAVPAGHVDGHGKRGAPEVARYEAAAEGELREETGLRAGPLNLVAEGRKDSPCRRPGGDWHYWRIYRTEASGEIVQAEREVTGYLWCDRTLMEELLALPVASSQDDELLEPVWKEWFREIDILSLYP